MNAIRIISRTGVEAAVTLLFVSWLAVVFFMFGCLTSSPPPARFRTRRLDSPANARVSGSDESSRPTVCRWDVAMADKGLRSIYETLPARQVATRKQLKAIRSTEYQGTFGGTRGEEWIEVATRITRQMVARASTLSRNAAELVDSELPRSGLRDRARPAGAKSTRCESRAQLIELGARRGARRAVLTPGFHVSTPAANRKSHARSTPARSQLARDRLRPPRAGRALP